MSQTVDVSALEVCAGMETDELKLRCFDAIISGSKPGATSAPAPSVAEAPPVEAPVAEAPPVPPIEAELADAPAAEVAAPPPASPPSEAPPVRETPTTAPRPAASERAPAAAVPSVPAAASTARDSAPAPAPEPAPAAAPEPTPEVAPATEFGREHLERARGGDENGDKLLVATVVEVTRGRNDILFFHLDNGQVWRQQESRHYSYPKGEPFEVNITQGMMGDYRMRIGDNGRMVRIRRVR